MEVGDQSIHDLEAVARRHIQRRFAVHRPDASRAEGGAFQCPGGCRTDRDDTAPCAVDDLGGLKAYRDALGVHSVGADVLGLDGPESPQADMKGDTGDLDTARLDPRQQFGGEVQARRGRGGGPARVGIDGLITLAPVRRQRGLDIGRQRGRGLSRNGVFHEDAGRRFKLEETPAPVIGLLGHLGCQIVPELHTGPRQHLLTRTHQSLPQTVGDPVGQERLDSLVGMTGPRAEQALCRHAGVVEHEHVATF